MKTAAWAGGVVLLMSGSPGMAQAVRVAGDAVQVEAPPTPLQSPPMIAPAGGGTVRVGAPPTPSTGQTSRVAGGSVKFHPNREKKELAVDFRLVDALTVTGVQAAAENGGAVPAKWNGWELAKSPACAWVIVVDTSVTSPAKTVGQYVDFVRTFVNRLPKQDSVAVCTMAAELKEAVPFDGTADEIAKGLAHIKRADGTASTTLIYARLRDALGRFAQRKEPRQALLVLSNGQDQSEGGPDAQDLEITKLVDAAYGAGVVIHALGSAENVAAKKHFAGLKEIALRTDGVFEAPAFGGEELPFGTMFRLQGIMHGAGSVRLDLSKLTQPADLTVTVKTAAGRSAELHVPAAKTADALGATPPPATEVAKEQTPTQAEPPAAPASTNPAKVPDEAAKQPATDKPVTAAPPEQPAPAKPALPMVTATPFKTWLWVLAAAGVLVLLMVALAIFLLLRKRGS